MDLSLREITQENLRDVLRLKVAEHQRAFVADNANSLAHAFVSSTAWPRAIYAGNEPVGFVMVHEDPEKGEYMLWRFMIAELHQGQGFGRTALELVMDRVRTLPDAAEFRTSVVQGPGGPQAFYERLGFVLTGEMLEGEAVLSIAL